MPQIKVESKFLKPNTNIYSEDFIRFKDAGRQEEGQFGKQWVFTVDVISGKTKQVVETDKSFTVGNTNLLTVIECYGDNSDNWVGKAFKVLIIKNKNGKDAVQLVAPPKARPQEAIANEQLQMEESKQEVEPEVIPQDLPF